MSVGPQTSGSDAHVVQLLEAYILGDLSKADETKLEAHLLRCNDCRAQCDTLTELGLLLARLPASIVGNLQGSGRARSARARVGRKVVGIAAVLMLGVAIGGLGRAWLAPHPATEVPVGNEQVSSLPGRLAVTTTDRVDGGLDVLAVVAGLRPGVNFQLIALASDERVYSVTGGRASGGPQQLVGSVSVVSANILLFAVIEDGDTIVAVSVR